MQRVQHRFYLWGGPDTHAYVGEPTPGGGAGGRAREHRLPEEAIEGKRDPHPTHIGKHRPHRGGDGRQEGDVERGE